MEEIKKAAFSFIGFKISDFSFQEPKSVSNKLSIDFLPQGNYSEPESVFELIITFIGTNIDENNSQIFKATLKAQFSFPVNTKFVDIPPYFYRNSIAIVFPYFRSFISTVTMQANVKLIILPLLNLLPLEEQLKKNSFVVNQESAQ